MATHPTTTLPTDRLPTALRSCSRSRRPLLAVAGLTLFGAFVAAAAMDPIRPFSPPGLPAGADLPAPSRLIAADDARLDAGTFIVHEWGTFTSFSGSDGVKLEFRPLVDSDLPDFVCDHDRHFGLKALQKAQVRARQRMETPVTYFYTDRVRRARVQVAFPKGILTEFYPPVERLLPAPRPADASGPAADVALQGGRLDWGEVTLLPESALRPALLDDAVANAVARRAFETLPPGSDPEPELYTGDHYYFARAVDSALVHVRHEGRLPAGDATGFAGPLSPRGDFFEKFLFYRGLGDFDLPVQATATATGGLRVANIGPRPIVGLVLAQVDGEQLAFSRLDDLPPGAALETPAPAALASEVEFWRQQQELGQLLQQILVAQGLYEKEAAAMVQTWAGSWFREQGTRLFYIVPQELTDELLPLTIEPAPQETVRVLVGRLEFMPAETERRIESLVEESARGWRAYSDKYELVRQSENADELLAKLQPHPVPEALRQLGRLCEPALVRIESIAREPSTRAEARRLRAVLRMESQQIDAAAR